MPMEKLFNEMNHTAKVSGRERILKEQAKIENSSIG